MSAIPLLDEKFDGTPSTVSPVSIQPKGDRTRRVMMVQPASAGGNFEYIAIPRQGMLFLSGALAQWEGPYVYERDIWFEDRLGRMDPDRDLDGVDVLMITSLINETPRAYELARQARQYHPNLVILGGGPQMSPLAEEAFARGDFDVIVNREGEDIIGQLCDILLTWRDDRKYQYLARVAGISYMQDGHLVATRRKGLVSPDFVELPDFRSIRGLSPGNPMAGAVLETVRGCTENCSYCQVIQQFLGYRLISRETEFKRLEQLEDLAADGLIHTGRNGKFNVFISDDLHTPPLRAVKFRNERLERLHGWQGRTDSMNMICQARAEIGQDDELADALLAANVKMLYLGVESNNAESLAAVRKRQEPGQMERDLVHLNEKRLFRRRHDHHRPALRHRGIHYDPGRLGHPAQPLPDRQPADAVACHLQLEPETPERRRPALAGRRNASLRAVHRTPVRSRGRTLEHGRKPGTVRQVQLEADVH